MENWETNLHDLLGSNNFHPYKKLNESLNQWCKEFASCFDRYPGMSAKCPFSPYNGKTELEISFGPWNTLKVFKAVVAFAPAEDDSFSLQIKFTTNFDFGKEMKIILYGKQEEDDCYMWEEEEFSGVESREKGYVLQLLLNRLEIFINAKKAWNLNQVISNE